MGATGQGELGEYSSTSFVGGPARIESNGKISGKIRGYQPFRRYS